ncbi:MAG: signal peptidase I [Candidatus Sericytochromatia bacterium]
MRKETRNHILTVSAALLFVLGARTAVAEPRYIPSESMLPTLKVQDRVLVEKLSLRFNPPRRGEILVFDPPYRHMPHGPVEQLEAWQGFGDYTPLIKRVVGLSGETLEISQGHVLINGKVLDESAYGTYPADYTFGPIKIPADQLFMMGDNRGNSADSHIWGPLPLKNVRGRAVFRFWPPQAIGNL